MTSHITARDVGPAGPGLRSVYVCAGPAGPEHRMVGALLMPEADAAELVARVEAGELQAEITPTIAAHVLFHFSAAGGMEAGGFTMTLILALARATRENFLRLAAAFPGYARAVDWAQNDPEGIAALQAIAGQLVLNPAPAPERAVRHGRC